MRNGEEGKANEKIVPLMISRQEVPKLFPGLSPKTLANMASKGEGPRFYKKKRLIFYFVKDLRKYLTGNTQYSPTPKNSKTRKKNPHLNGK